MKDLKREVASKALDYIQPGQTIGLGAGTTIGHLAEMIDKEIPFKESLSFVTSSAETARLLNKYHFRCLDASETEKIDFYFDSCDQVDENLNAFKSGGGIHTLEKIIASMASQFIILADIHKLVPVLTTDFPLCIEIIPEATAFVSARMTSLFPGCRVTVRMDKNVPLLTANGNRLADVYFNELPPLKTLNSLVKSILGMIDHSLFYGIAHTALISGPDDTKVLNSNDHP